MGGGELAIMMLNVMVFREKVKIRIRGKVEQKDTAKIGKFQN